MNDRPAASTPRPAAVLFILITVLLDMLSFGIIIPVLPKLVEEFLSGDTAKAAMIYGLMGTACIATGFLFFVEKRKRQHAKQGSQGARVVDALAVTTVTGMLIATLGILIANRLLPETLPAGMPGRGNLERYAFWFMWLLAMTHAFWRTAPVAHGGLSPAWREQCWAIAMMAVTAVLLNWITTGDHLLRTLRAAYWPVAGLDLAMLVTAAIALFSARTLKQRDSALARAAEVTREEIARA